MTGNRRVVRNSRQTYPHGDRASQGRRVQNTCPQRLTEAVGIRESRSAPDGWMKMKDTEDLPTTQIVGRRVNTSSDSPGIPGVAPTSEGRFLGLQTTPDGSEGFLRDQAGIPAAGGQRAVEGTGGALRGGRPGAVRRGPSGARHPERGVLGAGLLPTAVSARAPRQIP